jgi:hypothetical protein
MPQQTTGHCRIVLGASARLGPRRDAGRLLAYAHAVSESWEPLMLLLDDGEVEHYQLAALEVERSEDAGHRVLAGRARGRLKPRAAWKARSPYAARSAEGAGASSRSGHREPDGAGAAARRTIRVHKDDGEETLPRQSSARSARKPESAPNGASRSERSRSGPAPQFSLRARGGTVTLRR